MAEDATNERINRFIDRSITELQQANKNPIEGYEKEVVVPLEKAVQKLIPLVSNILQYVDDAKTKCNKASFTLTLNESAAIYLYTMPTSFFRLLNETLRAENRSALKPWFPFLKIFISALEKLPSSKLTVWRAVALDIGHFAFDNDMVTWWSVNSTSTNLNTIQVFLTEESTLFTIEALNGKDITEYSTFPDEQEVILIPGTRLRIITSATNLFGGFSIVHLEECRIEQNIPDNNPINLPLLSYSSSDVSIIDHDASLLLLPYHVPRVHLSSKRCKLMMLTCTLVISAITIGVILKLSFTKKISSNPYIKPEDTTPKASSSSCKPYDWNSTGTVVASGELFGGFTVDDQLNIYTLTHNKAVIKKWTPGVAEPLAMIIKEISPPYPLRGLFFHSASNSLYFGDYYNTVYKYNIELNEAVKVAFGNGRGSDLNQIKTVHDLFVDIARNIYVLDSFNSRVLKWEVMATSAVVVAAGGGDGHGADQLSSSSIGAPQFVVDIDNNVIYVVDTGNDRIQKYTIGSASGSTVLGGSTGSLSSPRSVAIDGAGNILVGSNSYIKKYRPGDISSDVVVASAAVLNRTMNEPWTLRFDRMGNLYTNDFQNQRIIKFAVTNSSCSSV